MDAISLPQESRYGPSGRGGVSYITDGELKRIGDTTYVLAPYNVDISGDFIEEINNISGSEDIFDSLD